MAVENEGRNRKGGRERFAWRVPTDAMGHPKCLCGQAIRQTEQKRSAISVAALDS
jgi:hypothetical protein